MDVLAIHFVVVDKHFSDLVEEAVDQRGIASPSGLLSALAAPMATFDGRDLHTDILTKAAVLMRSLIKNHPFRNGNKRTAVIATILFLEENGYELRVEDKRLIKLATLIASEPITVNRIFRWLKKYTRRIEAQHVSRIRGRYAESVRDWFNGVISRD